MQENSTPFYRAYLQEELSKRQNRRENYSLRSFARDLEIQAPTLSNVLKGKRNLSFYSALKITEILKVDENKKQDFLKSVLGSKKRGTRKNSSPLNRSLKVHDLFHDEIISDPIYFSVFSFLNSDIPVKNTQSISVSFGISEKKTKEVLAKLYAAKMIRFNGEEIIAATESIRSSDGVSSQAVKTAHKATLLNALEKLDLIPLHLREYRSLKFPVDCNTLPAIKKEIMNSIERIYKISKKGHSKKDVFEIAIQLFPLTQIGALNHE